VLEVEEYPAKKRTTSNIIFILGRELVYLDKYRPHLNIYKVTGSVLGSFFKKKKRNNTILNYI
jgi:hypothetical protein